MYNEMAILKLVQVSVLLQCVQYIISLELEGAKLPLYKVAVLHLLTPSGRYNLHLSLTLFICELCH